MATKSGVTVIFAKDDAFSLSTGCNILYGQESVDGNGDKMICVDDVVPLQENNYKEMPSKYTLNIKDSIINSRNSKFILGFVCNNNTMNREILFEMLKQELKFKIFCFLMVSINEIFARKSLVILYSGDSRAAPSCNITSMPKFEVRIVLPKRKSKSF